MSPELDRDADDPTIGSSGPDAGDRPPQPLAAPGTEPRPEGSPSSERNAGVAAPAATAGPGRGLPTGAPPDRPADGAKADGPGLADLPKKERRRRVRRARRDGRYLYRGRFVPRTLRAIAVVAVAMGLAAGAATATTYAIMDARVARAETAVAPAPEPTVPIEASIEAVGNPADPSVADILIDATATGGDATIEGLAVAVSADAERTYWLTAYDLVAASTVVPAGPITVRSTGGPAEAWSWDEERRLGLVATTDVDGTPRTWIPAEVTLEPGSLLAVILPTDGPPLPVTVAVEEPLSGPRDTFTIRADGTVLPLGAAVTSSDGRLVGVIIGADYADDNTVATVSAIRNACGDVLDCTDVGG